MKKTSADGHVVGLLIAFGLPAIAWVYFDWRAALAVFIGGQLLIGFAKILHNQGK